jgi:hypothetical protein
MNKRSGLSELQGANPGPPIPATTAGFPAHHGRRTALDCGGKHADLLGYSFVRTESDLLAGAAAEVQGRECWHQGFLHRKDCPLAR